MRNPAPRSGRVLLMGLAIDRLTQAQVIARVLEGLDAGRGGWIATPNLDQLRLVDGSPSIRRLMGGPDLSLADGMPLVWASRLMGDPLPERVPGSDLIWSLSAAAATRGAAVHLIGGAGDAGMRAAALLAGRNPGLRACEHVPLPMGYVPGPQTELEPVQDALRAEMPDLVFVGLGFPKQERLIAALRAEFPGTWFVGVGISFSFVSGEVRRAPRWMQALGLEWTHRLVQEPRRLARRYLLHGLPFALRLLIHAAAHRLRVGRGPPSRRRA